MSRFFLPEGAWLDWWSGEKFEGRRWIERPVDLETLPLYVRVSVIIPLDPARQFTAQSVAGATTLRIHPGANGTFTLYDDDGQSLGYRDGSGARTVWINCRWDDVKRVLTIAPDQRMKKWPGGARTFAVEVAGERGPPEQIEFKGKIVKMKLY